MHTIVALDTGEVYSFGLNASGQLGHNTTINLCYPTLIEKEWIAGQSYYDYLNRIQAQIDDAEPLDDSIYYMYQLFAGGDQSFVAVTSCERDYEVSSWIFMGLVYIAKCLYNIHTTHTHKSPTLLCEDKNWLPFFPTVTMKQQNQPSPVMEYLHRLLQKQTPPLTPLRGTSVSFPHPSSLSFSRTT